MGLRSFQGRTTRRAVMDRLGTAIGEVRGLVTSKSAFARRCPRLVALIRPRPGCIGASGICDRAAAGRWRVVRIVVAPALSRSGEPAPGQVDENTQESSAVISAQMNPASSRAIAARGHRRGLFSSKQGGEATVQAQLRGPRAGPGVRTHAVLAAAQGHADGGAVLTGPGRLQERAGLGADMGVAGFGQRTVGRSSCLRSIRWAPVRRSP